jgi:serine/alanine adding enzyme
VRESLPNSPGLDQAAVGDPTIRPWEGASAVWDEFVRSTPGSSFCHLSGWREVFSDVLGHECLYRAATGPTGSLEGVLPLVRVRSPVFGHYLLSVPFLNYGGALGTAAARRRLSEDAVRLAAETGVGLLELRGRGISPEPPLVEARRKLTVVLDLPGDAEALWSGGLKAKVRSQVRRPQKEGMTTRFGTSELEPFYRVFSRNMRDLGTPVLARRFFASIADRFSDEVEFGCVYLGDTPVAAGCGFVWRGEFEMTWASSLKEQARLAPNMLLYWSFMERMIGRGLTSFNFGRCTPDSGTHRFKLQWGGRDEVLPWGQWSKRGVSETPSPHRPIFALASKVWSHLPLAVANRLGPTIARQLP